MGDLANLVDQQLNDAGVPAEEPQPATIEEATAKKEAQEGPQEAQGREEKSKIPPGSEKFFEEKGKETEAQEKAAKKEAKEKAAAKEEKEAEKQAEESKGEEAEGRPPVKEEKPDPPPKPKKLTAKDVPDDLELDLEVEGEKVKTTLGDLKKSGQLRAYYDRQLRQVKQAQTQIQSTFKSLLADPIHTVEQLLTGQLGSGERAHQVVRQIVTEWMSREIELESMPDEQRQIVKQKRDLELERKRITEEHEAERSRLVEELRTTKQRQVDYEIREAIQKTGLPLEKPYYQEIARRMYLAAEQGENLTAEEAAATVQEELNSRFETMIRNLPPGDLLRRHPGLAKKLRETEQQRQTPPTNPAAPPTSSETLAKPERRETEPKKKRRFASSEEWHRYLNETFR